jgi:hypothetical protein
LRERSHEADRLDGVLLRPDAACCCQQRYGYDNETFHGFPLIGVEKPATSQESPVTQNPMSPGTGSGNRTLDQSSLIPAAFTIRPYFASSS